jgi:hypothetical protein
MSSDGLECPVLNQDHIDQSCVGEYKGAEVPSIPVLTNSEHLARCLFDLELEP